MEYCILVVQFAVGLTTYSTHCFTTQDERRAYVRELSRLTPTRINSEGILIRYVQRGEELSEAWQYVMAKKSLVP